MLNQLRIKKTFIVRHVIWKLKSYHNRLIQYQTEWVYLFPGVLPRYNCRWQILVLKVTYYVIFLFSVLVLCTLCCQFLLIVYFWFPLRYSLMFVYTCQVITFYFHWSKHLRLHFYYTCKFIIYELLMVLIIRCFEGT